MTCEYCETRSLRFDFGRRCCLVRWVAGAFRPHADAWLDVYQKKFGRDARLELIAEAKAYEANACDLEDGRHE
jgi:hypothetical protein